MRFLSISLPIILAVILALVAIALTGAYPMPPSGISSEKYDGFSGVLTISIDEKISAQFPTLQRWISEITNLFEKSNKGIYLSFTRNAQSPDIIIRAAGDSDARNYAPVGIYDLMPAFHSSKTSVPIAAGGYLLGINGDIPDSLSDLPDETIGYCDAFATIWVALCEQFSTEPTQKRTISTPDIGLIPTETPIPTAAPVVGTQILRKNLFTDSPDALYEAFLDGNLLALPLTENQAAKIRRQQENGRYAGIRFRNAALFTDRIAYASIPASSRGDADERTAVAREFIGFLLSEESQSRLARYDIFPTAMVAPVYEGETGMQTIENALRRSDCVTQAAEEPPIRADIGALLDGQISARELMRKLRNRQ